MFGHAGRHVGMMVLYAHQRHVPPRGQCLGRPGRGVIGVQIAGDQRRLGLKEIDQVVDRAAMDLDPQHALQIAHVGT